MSYPLKDVLQLYKSLEILSKLDKLGAEDQ